MDSELSCPRHSLMIGKDAPLCNNDIAKLWRRLWHPLCLPRVDIPALLMYSPNLVDILAGDIFRYGWPAVRKIVLRLACGRPFVI